MRNVYTEKCPHCKEGATFKKDGKLFSIPKMYDTCASCNYKFEREPGYFIGAMYLSYGLALTQGGIAFLLTKLFFPYLPDTWLIFIVILTFVLFAKKNFKWSRILYLYIFPW